MNTEEITGGVSPLKAKWKGTASRSGGQKRSISGKRGGAAGIRNTSKKSGKYAARKARGFSQTGAKGSNVHGYGALTRFKPIVTKDYKGPIAAATTPKSGGSGSGSGGGGGDTYNYGDYHDESRTQNWDNVGNYNEAEINAIKKDKNVITNKTNTKVKTDVDQTNKNKTNQKQKLESYDDFWNKRIESGEHSDGMKKYIKKHGGDLEKAREEWEYISRKYAHIRNKNRQSNESNVDVDASTDNTSDISSDQNVSRTSGTINIADQTFLKYDPAKRSPNKMKSHAWNMIQKQKKARGGTQKY
jgi:hypothetical protein